MITATDACETDEQKGISTYTGNSTANVYVRVELPDPRYERVLSGDRHISYVMVNQSDARNVVDGKGFDDILEPHHNLVIVGTEDDGIIINRNVYDDVDLLAELTRSVTFIPDYGWIYGDSMTDEEQMEAVRNYLDRLGKLCDLIERDGLHHVTVVPLAKGFNRDHFEEIAEVFDRLGFDRYAFYAVQTNSIKTLIEETRISITVLDPKEVIVIGRGSPSEVAKLPSRVNGVASLRYWKKVCDLDSDGYSEPDLIGWQADLKDSLDNGRIGRQSRLNDVLGTEVTA